MTGFPVTAIYAGLLALWLIYLQYSVIRFRRAHDVSVGDGGYEVGINLIRGHGNAAETVPIFLILPALSEGMGMPVWLIHLFGLSFLAGRVLHGVYFIRGREPLNQRVLGMALTLGATGLLAIGLILHAVLPF